VARSRRESEKIRLITEDIKEEEKNVKMKNWSNIYSE
jgi:hypothetical protein